MLYTRKFRRNAVFDEHMCGAGYGKSMVFGLRDGCFGFVMRVRDDLTRPSRVFMWEMNSLGVLAKGYDGICPMNDGSLEEDIKFWQ